MSKTMKAYEAREDGEGHCCIVFATNGAAARREGASELDTDWEAIESCVRKPEFDAYAPGPVPPIDLLAAGWWYECSHCGRRVSWDMSDEIEEGDDPESLVPRADGKTGVFCGATCEAESLAEKRLNAEAVDALAELFETKFPGATITRLHVYGPKLEKRSIGYGASATVHFRYPGAQYDAWFSFGESDVMVPQIDEPAFRAWIARQALCAPCEVPP